MLLKKSFGQHLLVAEPVLRRIASSLGATNNDLVMEIGPGTGKLTKHLLQSCGRLVAIEKDVDMVEALHTEFLDAERFSVIHADFLKVDIPATLDKFEGFERKLFCGNLPYNVSSPILFKIKEDRHLFECGVVMLQKEVARRLYAKPGSKDYGILSIMLQSVAKIEKVMDVGRGCFIPPPKVDSTVVKMTFLKEPLFRRSDEAIFEKLVKTAFGTRRKMLRNTLKDHLHAMETAGIKPTARPEELSVVEFARLAEIICVNLNLSNR